LSLLEATQAGEADYAAQRARVARLRERLRAIDRPEARQLETVADYLVKKSVWIVGGDGWAYDIGFGGLDHVLSLGRKVNILVLDTEVYSNTGGQMSKSTPIGASARFAAAGKARPKKDLGLMAMSYGNIYVARIAFGAKDAQTVKAFEEAESYPGTSLIIALSPCIAHGYEMNESLDHQKLAVETGYWPLFRFDPRRAEAGGHALELDSAPPRTDVAEFMKLETRFRQVEQENPERYAALVKAAESGIHERVALYKRLAER
ncbi:MAG TPA: thiamine pyrophosphate-dependent enzyme, partial [Planctomycetota bacterium]|nr:thiamine pyrophosphate-dependent enzyme [Planctomycetota bacterium]